MRFNVYDLNDMKLVNSKANHFGYSGNYMEPYNSYNTVPFVILITLAKAHLLPLATLI